MALFNLKEQDEKNGKRDSSELLVRQEAEWLAERNSRGEAVFSSSSSSPFSLRSPSD